MSGTLIVGLIFFAILIGFLIVTFFIKGKLEPSQYNTLHFLTAMCAGCAGGFIAGGALVEINAEIGTGQKMGISATAGFALLIIIWFTYPKRTPPPLKDAFHFRIQGGWTFQQAVQSIAMASHSSSSFTNFSDSELSLLLIPYELHEKTAADAINKLRTLNAQLPGYQVELSNNTYTVKKV
jgi:hypothetical protein